MHTERYLDFSKNCSNVIHSNVIHKFMFPLIFFYVNKFLYGLLYSKDIVLTLASIAIFVPLLLQIKHKG